MVFKGDAWVLVCDTEIDPYSKPQIEKINELAIQIRGAIQCGDAKFKDSEPCKKVPAFPSFCNTETSICVPGFRDTKELFEDLQTISDEKKE